jgi:site-specific DNA-methyltransferase (adenine-specific)
MIFHSDNLELVRLLPDGCARLVYIDPPFNTGKVQAARRIRTRKHANGDGIGFGGGHRYSTERLGTASYEDSFTDYLAFLGPRLHEARRKEPQPRSARPLLNENVERFALELE